MNQPSTIPNEERVVALFGTRGHQPSEPPSSGNGDGGGPTDSMERRVAALEKSHDLIIGKLDTLLDKVRDGRVDLEKRLGAIESRLTGIEKDLFTKATGSELKLVEGKVSSIPNTWQIVGLMGALIFGTLGGVAALAFVLAKYAGKAG